FMHHPSGTLGMTQGYIRIQIDFAHFRTQLELLHVLAGTFEINIGTALFRTRENPDDVTVGK
ncbi:MAG TPA: hypothetical protein VFL79_14990, partial [Terriglobia bacterium]|nr:hypothetical protein [Terriglobia bacterium]